MLGKLLGRLAYRGWRDGDRADRRWAKGRDERLWKRDAEVDRFWFQDWDSEPDPHSFSCTCRFCRTPWAPPVCQTCSSYPCTCKSGAYGWR